MAPIDIFWLLNLSIVSALVLALLMLTAPLKEIVIWRPICLAVRIFLKIFISGYICHIDTLSTLYKSYLYQIKSPTTWKYKYSSMEI